MKKIYKISDFWVLIIVSQFLVLNSCKKFTNVDLPADQLYSDLVFSDSSTAISAITGIYSQMLTDRNLFTNSATTLYCGLAADELYFYTRSLKDEFSENQITQENHINIDNSFWKPAYKNIYSANLAIEKLEVSDQLSISLKRQLIGEAKFIRAFCYFHLTNIFGDVPLMISSRYQDAVSSPRVATSEVYAQIITDLIEAKALLNTNYNSADRVRPNKWAAVALLSRCYLYTSQWKRAEEEATSIISSGQYLLGTNPDNVFLKGSAEAIWQLMPVRPGFNTYEALEILPVSVFSSPTYLITPTLYNSFETADKRKISWISSRVFNNDTLYYPFKYKFSNSTILSEYYMVFRLAELYLIRAEAEVNQNKLSDAKSDINIIRNRAGLPNTSASDIRLLKLAIEEERRAEFCFEWGNRWYDLKRTGRASEVLAPLKGGSWQSTDTLWPIPKQEIDMNPSLTQNDGY